MDAAAPAGDDPGTVPVAAGAVRHVLEELGLAAYVKSSGSRRIHVQAAAYGVRPKDGAPVAVPLAWDEATSSQFDPQRVTVRTAFRRISQKPDSWKGMTRRARSLAEPRERLQSMLDDA